LVRTSVHLEIVPRDVDEPQRRRPEAKASHKTEHKPEREHDERRRDAAAGAGAAAMVAGNVLVVAGASFFFYPALITRHAKCIKNKWITQEILS
jgi:hypothetical protein